jgi:DNA mismatch repair protein MutS
LPNEVVRRAREVLAEHESAERRASDKLSHDETPDQPLQLTIFTPLSQKIVDQLRQTDLDHLTPLEALNLLSTLKKQLD